MTTMTCARVVDLHHMLSHGDPMGLTWPEVVDLHYAMKLKRDGVYVPEPKRSDYGPEARILGRRLVILPDDWAVSHASHAHEPAGQTTHSA